MFNSDLDQTQLKPWHYYHWYLKDEMKNVDDKQWFHYRRKAAIFLIFWVPQGK